MESICSTDLDIIGHIRRVYVNEADAGNDPIALGVCTQGDFRVGPVREVQRHLGVVCVARVVTTTTDQAAMASTGSPARPCPI